MQCDPNVKFLSNVPEQILNILDKEIESWDFRNFNNFSNIPVFEIVKSIEYTGKNSEKTLDTLKEVFQWFEKFFPGKIPIYANMLAIFPGQRYPIHIDSLELHSVSHRIHIPLITEDDSKLWFFKKTQGTWASETFHIARGGAWEMSNLTPHSAENLSDSWRVHFVVDFIDKELKNSKNIEFWKQVNPQWVKYSNLVNQEFENTEDSNLKRWSRTSVKQNNLRIISLHS